MDSAPTVRQTMMGGMDNCMTYDPQIHRRRSIRLRGYDYSQAGQYFVTICTQNRLHLFGEIMAGRMVLNDAGKMVAETWLWLQQQYDYVDLGKWVIMPNHLHGMLSIIDGCRGGSRTAPTGGNVPGKPLGRLIGAFKTVSTKQNNETRNTPGMKLWQRNYWEHIVRNDNEYVRISQYIIDNPAKWQNDKLNGGSGNQVMEPQTLYSEEVWMV